MFVDSWDCVSPVLLCWEKSPQTDSRSDYVSFIISDHSGDVSGFSLSCLRSWGEAAAGFLQHKPPAYLIQTSLVPVWTHVHLLSLCWFCLFAGGCSRQQGVCARLLLWRSCCCTMWAMASVRWECCTSVSVCANRILCWAEWSEAIVIMFTL